VLEVLSNAVHELSDSELRDSVAAVQPAINRLQAKQAEPLSEWDAKRVWADDGPKSTGLVWRVKCLSLRQKPSTWF